MPGTHQIALKDGLAQSLVCSCRSHITRYLGVGTALADSSIVDEAAARRVIDATYIVQEYIDGGNLRGQVLKQCPGRLPCLALKVFLPATTLSTESRRAQASIMRQHLTA